MKVQKKKTGNIMEFVKYENIKKLVYILPLVILTGSITMYNTAYAAVYGYYATEPTGGTFTNLSESIGDVFTYTGNMNGASNFAHINRMVYLTDVSSYSVGLGYIDGVDGTGTEYYKYMYYIDDGTVNDNLTDIITGSGPTSGSTHLADVDRTSGGGTHDFTFYIDGSSRASYACSDSCSNPIVVSGASSWGDETSTTENIRADISLLKLAEDGNTPIAWSSDGGEIKCNTDGSFVNLSNNEFTAGGSMGCTNNPNNGWLYNDQLGG